MRFPRTFALTSVRLVAAACLASSCSSDPSSKDGAANGGSNSNVNAEQQSQNSALLSFAQCMRSHGMADFPDPGPGGTLQLPSSLDPNSPQFNNAFQACQSDLPAGQEEPNSPQNLAGLAKFATCMTQHGVAVSVGANGQISMGQGVDPQSAQFQAANQECAKLVPNGLPMGGGSR